jgi:hypothetical protein
MVLCGALRCRSCPSKATRPIASPPTRVELAIAVAGSAPAGMSKAITGPSRLLTTYVRGVQPASWQASRCVGSPVRVTMPEDW